MARIALHYHPVDSWLHRWDARCKTSGLMIITLSLIQFKTPLFLFNSVMLIGLFILSQFPLKQFLREFRLWAILLFILFLFQTLFSSGDRISFLPWLPISKEGLTLGGITVWRLGLILCYATLFTAITRPRELQDAITWFIKPFPFLSERRIGLMVSLTIRFFSITLDEAEEIRLAHKARLGDKNKNPIRMAKFLSIPLLRRSFSRAEDVTLALAVRGYRDDLPVQLNKIPIGQWIPLFVLLGILILIRWVQF